MTPPRRLAVALGLTAAAAAQDPGDDVVRAAHAILSDRCYPCHGPDGARREAGLRLDRRDDALGALDSGHRAVVPFAPGDSELLARVTAADREDRMPPARSKRTVTAAEIEVLRRWIAAGAAWPSDTFAPLPRRVAVPAADGDAPQRNAIDAFVLERLHHVGRSPAPPAPPQTLLRRATLTLTGLPPTLDELDAFLADGGDAGAVDRAIDRLLESPRHAEHMAAMWLDVARYGDTYGYQADAHREVWPWRDFVLRAFRDNLPYDRFVTWQLAGDLLPDAGREQRLATCFQRLHRQTNEGGSVEEEFRVEYVADRVHTFGTAFLGLTLECARCHDHKFDPISQREYYALFAFFDDIDECGLYSHFTTAVPTPALDLPTAEQERELERADAAVAAAEAASRQPLDAEDELRAWLAAPPPTEVPGELAQFALDAIGDGGRLAEACGRDVRGEAERPQGVRTTDGPRGRPALEVDGESALRFDLAAFTRDDAFTLALWVRPGRHSERAVLLHRSRAWTDAGSRGYELLLEDDRPNAALIHFWPGDAIRVRARRALEPGRWTHLALTYDGSSRAAGLRLYRDGEPEVVDVVRDGLHRTIRGGGETHLVLGERFRDRGFAGGAFADLRVFDRALAPLEVATVHRPDALAEAWGDPAARPELRRVFAARHAGQRARQGELQRARHRRSEVVDQVRAIMVMRDMPQPRTAHVLARGRYDQPGAAVAPDTPAALPPFPDGAPRDRLGLARWLTAPDHPLLARVFVNRVWAMHFGRGLVATPENHGAQGAPATHPRLLDWLARWFVDSGWDIRALHRLILSSATWRRSSAVAADGDGDPDNALLARGPRFRLPAEAIRDGALLAGGVLVEQFGGPPVKPWQPDGLWREKSGTAYHRDPGEGSRRRSLYTYWRRTSPPPSMMLLDASKRDVCTVSRPRTTTPLQALLVWNDPQYVDAAKGLAARCLQAVPEVDDAARARFLLRALTAREPEVDEVAAVADALRVEREAYATAPVTAHQLLLTGDVEVPAQLDRIALAAATAVAGSLLSLDEVWTLR